MGTDWQRETQAWVDDGIIEAEQRDAVLERLEQLPTSSALASGALMTVLVTPAAFLLIGAAVALMAALMDPPKVAYDSLIGGATLLLVVAGGLGRFVPSVRPLARGLLAAAVPTATYTLISTLHELDMPMLALLGVVPPVAAWAGGWLENSRAITASAALLTVMATVYALIAAEVAAAGMLVSFGCLLALVGSLALRLVVPSRDQVLQVGAPALVFLGAILLTLHQSFLGSMLKAAGVRDVWAIEKGLLVLAFGTVSLAVGLLARSGWALVPAVLCMAAATVWLAFTVGSFLGGAVALAVVSLGLFGGATLLWLLPWLRSAMSSEEEATS